MSWEASAWAMRKGKDYELEPITRFVMLTLANYADKEGNDIYPSLRTLEADTGLSERTIRRHIKTLIAVGLMDYGDQSIVGNNPRYRNDKLPKVYRFLFEREEGTGLPDFGGFGRLPSARNTPKNNDRTQSPPAQAVDNSPEFDNETVNDRTESPERPDRESGTTGHTGGQRVHQTYNPSINPLGEPAPGPSPEEIEAGIRLREEIRKRNLERGTWAQERKSA